MQRILPQDVDFVKEYFFGKKPDEYIFEKNELNNKINYHRLRAKHARECYDYYSKLLKDNPSYREIMIADIQDYCLKNRKNKKTGKPMKIADKDIRGILYLRGESRKFAEANSLPVAYDKTILMTISVFHLAHYRNDVTVASYMLAI